MRLQARCSGPYRVNVAAARGLHQIAAALALLMRHTLIHQVVKRPGCADFDSTAGIVGRRAYCATTGVGNLVYATAILIHAIHAHFDQPACSMPRSHRDTLLIEWNGERLGLHAQRAVSWPARRTLIVADAHFGKAAAFRAAGVPVPGGTTQNDLKRLDALLDQTRSTRLIVLGDFFHAASGRVEQTMNALSQWRRERASLDIMLVRGNHDLHAGDPPADWGFTCVDEPLVDGPLAFRHALEEKNRAAMPGANGSSDARRCSKAVKASQQADVLPTLAGHVHPCAVLRDDDGSTMRLPCFLFRPGEAILPAFGSFTGMHPVRPRAGMRGKASPDRIFVIGSGAVVEVKGRSAWQKAEC